MHTIERVFVAGIPVRDEAVLELARLIDDPDLAGKLETAYGRETRVLALTIPDGRKSSPRLRTHRLTSRSFAACCSESWRG